VRYATTMPSSSDWLATGSSAGGAVSSSSGTGMLPSAPEKSPAYYRTNVHTRIAASLAEICASKKRRAVMTHRQKEISKNETLPEVSPGVVQTIKRVICGDKCSGLDASREVPATRLQQDKQTSFATDELQAGARDLKPSERERIEGVFREVARGAGLVDEKAKDFKWSQVTLPWGDFARHLRGKLPNAHIQRLAVYFNFSKTRMRLGGYMERVGLLLTCSPEKRLRICFSLLDINGDGIIGPRDVFAALPRDNGEEDQVGVDPLDDAKNSISVPVVFANPGQLGLDFHDEETSILQVVGVVPGSPAEQQGVKPGDCLTHINNVSAIRLTPQEVRAMLTRPERPLQLLFVRREKKSGKGNNFLPPRIFETLLRTVTERDRISTRLKVTIVSARGLRNSDASGGGRSDPYCVCEVEGKSQVRFQTKVVNDCLDPEWNEEKELTNYVAGDSLKFTIRDRDFGSKVDESLGQVTLASSRFLPNGLDQEVNLSGAGKGNRATLRLKIVNLGDGGIAYEEFASSFGSQELPFLPALIEELTGTDISAVKQRAAGKVKVTVISACGLRSADCGGKSDPYCVVEIPGKPHLKFQTNAIPETLDPVWHKRGELEYAKGDALKFSVFDKDPGATANHESLGHVTLTSWRLHPFGFDGELELADAGKGFMPKLRVKVVMPGTTPSAGDASSPTSPSAARGAASGATAGAGGAAGETLDASVLLRHASELEDVQRMPHCSKEDAGWYVRSFEALCDPDRRLRRKPMAAAAQQLLGLPSYMLAGRFFDVVDADHCGEVGLHTWVVTLDRFFGHIWEQGQQRSSLSFAMYDLDGDGVISVQDAVHMAGEVERLAGVLGHPAEGPSLPICEEMRLLYGKVADSTDTCSNKGSTLDLFLFNQVLTHPVIHDTLREGLECIGRVHTPPPPTPPPNNIIELVAGEWTTISGDPLFQGLKIDLDGKFQCETNRTQDGFVRPMSPAGRRINFRRTKRDKNDYIFEVQEDGLRMSGQCPQSSATWVLQKVQALAGA